MENRRLKDSEACVILGVSKAVMKYWRYHGRGPVFHRVGGRVVYLESDLYTYIQAGRVDPAPQAQAAVHG
jgi:predicted site-specific integrase-resolvase